MGARLILCVESAALFCGGLGWDGLVGVVGVGRLSRRKAGGWRAATPAVPGIGPRGLLEDCESAGAFA
jgi:hypothetical protein